MATGPGYAHIRGLQTPETAPVHEVRGWKYAVLWLLATLLRTWARSLRFEADAATHARLAYAEKPAALIIWHNRLFISSEYFRRYRKNRKVYVLVSPSKDGAWSAGFHRLLGVHPIRGSSSNFGREAGKALIEVMRAGHDIALTPDGPRGPLYEVKPGVLVMTRRTHSPIVLVGVEYTRFWRLKGWDRFYIPVPFSRVNLRCTILPPIRADGEKQTADDVRTALLAVSPERSD